MEDVENLEEQISEWIKEFGEEDGGKSDDEIKHPEKKKKRQGKKTSSIWDHFIVVASADPAHPMAACNYCGLDYATDIKRCGTSTLWGHVYRKCKKCPFSEWVEENKKKQASILRFTKSNASTNPEEEVTSSGQPVKFSQKVVRDEIASYVVLDELPFRDVDGKGFQKLIRLFHSLPVEFPYQ